MLCRILLFTALASGPGHLPALRAAAPPYVLPDEPELSEDPFPFRLADPFKVAVVGGRMLVHREENGFVCTQVVALDMPARLRPFFPPESPYPGDDEKILKRKRTGLTLTAWLTRFPVRWHVTKNACYVVEATCGAGLSSIEVLHRFDLEELLAGKVQSTFAEHKGPKRDYRFTPASPGRRVRLFGLGSNFDHEVFYDYLPDGDRAARQFVLTNTRGKVMSKVFVDRPTISWIEQTPDERDNPHWSFTVHRCSSVWDKKARRWKPGPWSKEADLPVAFKEHFQAMPKGDDWFFLTSSGKLFVAKKPAKGGKRKNVLVYGDAKRPIRGTIVDAREQRRFLFLDTAKGPAFFELSDKPRFVVYDPKEAKMPTGDEPLRSIMHKARILAALGKIKGK